MEVRLVGQGGEVFVGKLSQDQYDFWSEQDYDDVVNHFFHEEDDIDVPDECSVGSVYDMADLANYYGGTASLSRLQVVSDAGKTLYDKPILEALEDVAVHVGSDVKYGVDFGGKNADHFFEAISEEDGLLTVIDVEGDAFDPFLVTMSLHKFNDRNAIVCLESYGDQLAEPGDSDSKGASIKLF